MKFIRKLKVSCLQKKIKYWKKKFGRHTISRLSDVMIRIPPGRLFTMDASCQAAKCVAVRALELERCSRSKAPLPELFQGIVTLESLGAGYR